MSPPPAAHPPWYACARAGRLLGALGPRDLRLELHRGCPGPDRLAWHADTARAARVFAALKQLRTRARTAAGSPPPTMPTLADALATRFPDPARWTGLDPVDATRRFRAHFRDAAAQADRNIRSTPPTACIAAISNAAGRPVR